MTTNKRLGPNCLWFLKYNSLSIKRFPCSILFWKHALLLFTEQQIIMNIKYASLQNTKYQTNPSFCTGGINTNIKDKYQTNVIFLHREWSWYTKYQRQISNERSIFAQGVIMKTEREDNWENTNSEVVQQKMHFFQVLFFQFSFLDDNQEKILLLWCFFGMPTLQRHDSSSFFRTHFQNL